MKKFITKFVIIAISLALFAPSMLVARPAFAANKKDCVETAILDGCQEPEGILNLVVDIMTVGIGVLGVIGITVVGIQYLTAGGSEEKVRKSKRRMFEIIIGLVAYVVLYAALRWLLPSFGK